MWLIAGIAVLDLGVQGIHISNQIAIYSLAPEARSRLTTAYMVTYFLGGAALSAISSAVYSTDGWTGVCVVGAATGLAALALGPPPSSRAASRGPRRRVTSATRPASLVSPDLGVGAAGSQPTPAVELSCRAALHSSQDEKRP